MARILYNLSAQIVLWIDIIAFKRLKIILGHQILEKVGLGQLRDFFFLRNPVKGIKSSEFVDCTI